jgi:hypothetical protein
MSHRAKYRWSCPVDAKELAAPSCRFMGSDLKKKKITTTASPSCHFVGSDLKKKAQQHALKTERLYTGNRGRKE